MIERESIHIKFGLFQHAPAKAARKLLHVQSKFELQFGCAKRRKEIVAQTFRTENIQRFFTAVEMECAEQAGDSVQVIAVQMSDENAVDSASLHARAHELNLSSFPA